LKSIRFKLFIILLLFLVAFTFTACRQKDEVVAFVNGEELKSDVLEDKLDKYIKSMESQGYTFEGEDGEAQKDEFRKQLLSEMIEYTLMEQAAEAEGITLESGQVEDELDSIKESMGEENFSKALAESFLTEQDVKDMLEQQLIMEALFNKVTSEVTAEEEEFIEFYEENKEYLITMKVSHILIEAREDTATDEERQVAKEKAQELITRLNSGEDFSELAKEYSDEPGAAESGGTMEYYFTENDTNLDPKFTKGAYELSVGEYSQDPVESSFGYHIIFAEDKIEDYEKLKEDIEAYVLNGEKNIVFDEYFSKIYADAEIDNLLIEEEIEEETEEETENN